MSALKGKEMGDVVEEEDEVEGELRLESDGGEDEDDDDETSNDLNTMKKNDNNENKADDGASKVENEASSSVTEANVVDGVTRDDLAESPAATLKERKEHPIFSTPAALLEHLKSPRSQDDNVYIRDDAFFFEEEGSDMLPHKVVETEKTSLSTLKVGSHNLKEESDIWETLNVRVEEFAAVTLFAERGFFSRHIYQPNVNHRHMNFDMFVDARDGPNGAQMNPLNDSMVFPTANNTFSGGFPMALFFYELKDACEEPATTTLNSPNSLNLEIGNDKSLRYLNLFGKIRNKEAAILTKESFELTLKVFGKKRNKNYTDKCVGSTEVAEFLRLLCKQKIGSVEKLTNFVKAFKLQWLYTVTGDPIEEQLLYFGSMIRSVTPMRVAAYDGRHRFNLCCYFADGIFLPTATVPLDSSKKFVDVFKPRILYDGSSLQPEYGKCALFLEQCFNVTVPKEEVTLKNVIHSMISKGSAATRNQGLMVETTMISVILEYIEHVLCNTKAISLKPYDYDNFWSVPQAEWTSVTIGGKTIPSNVIDFNMTQLYDLLVDFLESRQMHFNLLKGGTGKDLSKDDTLKLCRPTLTGLRDVNPILAYPDRRPPKKVSGHFALLLSSLKFVSHSTQGLMLLRRYLQCRQFVYEQGFIEPDDMCMLTSIEYFEWGPNYIASEAAHVFGMRYVLEKALMEACRLANGDDYLHDDITEGWPRVNEFWNKSKDENVLEIKKCLQNLNLSDARLGLKSVIITKKLQFAAHCAIVQDLYETICHFGYNPKIQHEGARNQGFQLYVDGFKEWAEDIVVPDFDANTSIPRAQEKKLKMAISKKIFKGHYSMIMMLHLYPEWLTKSKLPTVGFDLLAKVAPPESLVNRGNNRSSKGRCFLSNGALVGIPDDGKKYCTLDLFWSKSWSFRYFVENVVNNTIDFDTIPSFNRFIEPYLDLLNQKYQSLVENNSEGKELPSYTVKRLRSKPSPMNRAAAFDEGSHATNHGDEEVGTNDTPVKDSKETVSNSSSKKKSHRRDTDVSPPKDRKSGTSGKQPKAAKIKDGDDEDDGTKYSASTSNAAAVVKALFYPNKHGLAVSKFVGLDNADVASIFQLLTEHDVVSQVKLRKNKLCKFVEVAMERKFGHEKLEKLLLKAPQIREKWKIISSSSPPRPNVSDESKAGAKPGSSASKRAASRTTGDSDPRSVKRAKTVDGQLEESASTEDDP